MAFETITWMILATVIALGVLAVFMFKKGKFKTDEIDYRTHFIIGIVWIPLGIALDMTAFWALGLVFMAVGLVNYKKWGKPVKMTKKQQKIRTWIIIGLVIAVVLTAVIMLLSGA